MLILSEQEKTMHRCCFTGHRPEKLNRSKSQICFDLEKKIHQSITDGFTVYISGMARGVDLWAAEIILSLREKGYGTKLICACAYEGMEQTWKEMWQQSYHNILSAADAVRFISPAYSRNVFQKRNEWMVDHSARIIAVYNGSPGGTKNTLRYAANKIDIHYIEG